MVCERIKQPYLKLEAFSPHPTPWEATYTEIYGHVTRYSCDGNNNGGVASTIALNQTFYKFNGIYLPNILFPHAHEGTSTLC